VAEIGAGGVRANVDMGTGMVQGIEVDSGAEQWTIARGDDVGGMHDGPPKTLTVHDNQTRFTLTLRQTQVGGNE